MEKYSIQIDTSIKICYDCKSKAVIVIEKKYYCATCGLHKSTKGLNGQGNKTSKRQNT
tara:strand:- start:2 stop:175 length:174 start_codon:yes stop_codon:yes gene_type:complete